MCDYTFTGNKLTIHTKDISKFRNILYQVRWDNIHELVCFGLSLTELPTEIFNLLNLTILDCSNNKITHIHREIFRLKKLEYLVINKNRLISIPREIQFLTNLSYLNCSNNLLTKLPNKITSLPDLSELYCSHNILLTLPRGIERMKNLDILDCSHNDLNSIPIFNGIINVFRIIYHGNPIGERPKIVFNTAKISESYNREELQRTRKSQKKKCRLCNSENVEKIGKYNYCTECKPSCFSDINEPGYLYISNKKINLLSKTCTLCNNSYKIRKINDFEGTLSCVNCGYSPRDIKFYYNTMKGIWERYYDSGDHSGCRYCWNNTSKSNELITSVIKTSNLVDLNFMLQWSSERLKCHPKNPRTDRVLDKDCPRGKYIDLENEYFSLLIKVNGDCNIQDTSECLRISKESRGWKKLINFFIH